jgi:hypothetical protein
VRFRKTKYTVNPDALKAIEEAQKNLREVKERGPEVRKISEASKKLRMENHFAINLRRLIEGAR